MKIVLLLVLLSSASNGSRSVIGRPGGRVTLSCSYDITRNGALAVCWCRGDLPVSGCGNQPLLSTDGHQVTGPVSSRYQLLGRLEDGDVSMTIQNVSETDAGRYGCRVHIRGWFNDDKHHIDLLVETAPQTTSSPTLKATTSSETTEDVSTTGQVTSAESLQTSSSSSSVTAEDSSSVLLVLLCVLLALAASVTAAILIAYRRRRLSKISQQQQVYTRVQFMSPLSPLHLQTQSPVVENIYQIDDSGEGGEYEYCP